MRFRGILDEGAHISMAGQGSVWGWEYKRTGGLGQLDQWLMPLNLGLPSS
jgi:hypothetical protein